MIDRRFTIAPMMDCTDRHFRHLLRLITRQSVLYTEMITTGALIHGDRERFLKYNQSEHPVALQIGGSEPRDMGTCAKFAQDAGYDEVNINVGCPSDRVQSGQFGACLMANPDLVAECVARMNAAVTIPVTVKSRIGIDAQDSYGELLEFVNKVEAAGCNTFIIHARKAWLKGLSPRENRDVPPLRYDVVYQLKRDFPHLKIIINGGIKTLHETQQHLQHVDGVMLGREAYSNPYLLAEVDRLIYNDEHDIPTRFDILQNYLPYIETQLSEGIYLKHITRHMIGLFQGLPGAKAWRRYISEHAYKEGAGIEVIEEAAKRITELQVEARAS